MTRLGLLVAIVGATFAAAPGGPAEAADAASDFGRIASLVGEWHGSFEWSGARTDRGEMDATYRTTGHGTAVMEDLISAGETIMTSVYHRDGPALRMTHYCGAGNQPRLKAEPAPDDPRDIRFAFVDATNLGDPPAPHVDRLEMRFLDATHLQLTFRFTSPKGASLEHIALTRSPGKSSGG